MTRSEAYEIARFLRALAAAADDRTASLLPSMTDTLHGDGSLIKAGTRIRWQGKLKRAAVDIWDTAGNTPDAAPALWEDIDYIDGIRCIQDTISVTAAFSNGEQGIDADGNIWRSLTDNNVYTPKQYASNWEQLIKQ